VFAINGSESSSTPETLALLELIRIDIVALLDFTETEA